MITQPTGDPTQIVLDDPSTDVDDTPSDGRQLRRLRNIDAVRSVILDMYEHREHPDLDTVADRAGLTVRSIYRYHADLDAAISDALQSRVDEIYAVWGAQRLPSPDEPLADRVAAMLDHRLALEELGRPLRQTVQVTSPDPRFDAQVIEVFGPEFDRLSDGERDVAQASVCFLLRPRQLRSMIEFPHHGGVAPRDVIAYTIRRLLDQSAPPSDG